MLFIMSHVTSALRAGRRRRPIAALVQDTPPRRSDGFKIGSGARADDSVSNGRQCQLSVADDGRVLCTCCISRSSEHGSAQTACGERAQECTRAVLLATFAG